MGALSKSASHRRAAGNPNVAQAQGDVLFNPLQHEDPRSAPALLTRTDTKPATFPPVSVI